MLTKKEMFSYYLNDKSEGDYIYCLKTYYPELLEDKTHENELWELFCILEHAKYNLEDFVDEMMDYDSN